MTNEEALKIAKSSNPLLRGKIPLDRLNYVGCIIEALEKQIPMKADGLSCPVCKWNVIDRDGNKANYCRHCGQRLE